MTNRTSRPNRTLFALSGGQRLGLLLGTTALAALLSLPVAAQTASANGNDATQSAQNVRSFAIPPQPLAGALRQFSEQSGIQFAYPTQDLQGLASPGVQGEHAPEAALRLLLSGTSVSYRFTAANTVTLGRDGGALTLPPVSAESRILPPGQTEGTGSYTSTMSTIGSKLPVSNREIPQSLSVVTRQRIEDQNMKTMGDALEKTVGVTVAPGFAEYDGVLISRGYSVSTIQVDGVVNSYSFAEQARDLVMYDSVEVLRGPSGLFTGAGEPGATINLVRKRAQPEFGVQANAFAGSWNYKRGEIDVTGPLVESGHIRGRLVSAYEDRNWFSDDAEMMRRVFYGTFDFDLSDLTTLTVGSSYARTDALPMSTMPAYTNGNFLNISRSHSLRQDWEYTDYAGGDAFVELVQKLDEGWKWKSILRYANEGRSFKYTVGTNGVNPATNQSTFRTTQNDNAQERATADTNLSGSIELFGRKHDFVFGADYEEEWGEATQYANGANFIVNVFNPPTIAEPNLAITQVNRSGERQAGLYSQGRFRLNDWFSFIGGSRYTYWNTWNQTDFPTEGERTGRSVRHQITPYAGVVADLTNEVSVYASYTDIFQPQSARQVSGEYLDPRIGAQYEIGTKGEFYGGDLTASAAVYRIQDKNRALTDPDNVGFSIPAGEILTRGFEFEVGGRPSRNWDIHAGYNYNISEYVSDTTNPGGNAQTQQPHHTFTLWGNYTFREGELRGLSLGAGAHVVSSFGIARNNIPVYEDGYMRFDARVAYQLTENVTASLTLENLTDEYYYRYVNGHIQGNLFGAPRNVMFVLRTKL